MERGDHRSVTMETVDPVLAQADQNSVKKSVTLQSHPGFYSVSVTCPKWDCLSGLAPLKPVIGLRPVRGWPAGLTWNSSCLTLYWKPHMLKTPNRILLRGCFHLVSSFLIFSWGWLLRQQIISSLLEVALTDHNHNMSEHLTTSAQSTHTHTLIFWAPPIDLIRFDPVL